MFTRKALKNNIDNFISDLRQAGYSPARVVLFGSYANGHPHELSDIDLAVWDEKFTGCGSIDIVPIASIVSKYKQLELHTFNDKDESDPFADEVLKTGQLIH